MSERSDLDRRLRAVERALTDGDHDVATLQDAAEIGDRLDALEARISDLEDRTDELDAATQAVRGYVGNVRSVNDAVERRADAAIAAVDRIEDRLDGGNGPHGQTEFHGANAARHRYRGEEPRDRRAATDGESEQPDDVSIEMQPGSGQTPADRSRPTEDTDRSVIERVREVL